MWINCRTEFTFKAVYGHLDQVAAKCARLGSVGGIADMNNTFGHIRWRKACKKAGIKPIYGVRLPVVEDLELRERRYAFNYMTLIAKNQEGLQEIYWLVDQAHLQFYYRPRISYQQINETTDNVIVLGGVAPNWDIITREVYHELSNQTPYSQRNISKIAVACIDNFYPEATDKIIYEPFADDRLRETKSYPLHILTKEEWIAEFPGRQDALENLQSISDECNVELPNAPMVSYIGDDNIDDWCAKGAIEKGLNIQDGEYGERYKREMDLIHEKDYVDYFLVTADLIRYAKTKMAVGPSRGSSAGSLVCYLMGITEIDPLEYDLYFERFIDVNRFDLPDIDIDFQDDKRHLVIKYLEKKYGKDNVAQIGNISRMKPKSAITRFAKALNIPLDDVEELKDAIMERSGGDARANACIEDSINDTDVGRRFIEKYPNMKVLSKIEAHASHTGVHAAGILVCNEPITSYAGINSRDNKRIAMLDKKDAEAINLLKIDALGLRTLTILAAVCDQIGKPYNWLYEIPLDDEKTYDIFNNHRYNGIFQFEGHAIKSLAILMPVENMEDISALGALGRPGPLNSGGANRYVKFRSGEAEVKYVSDHPIVVEATESTFGVIVYQEQVMKIVRELGQLSWKDTSAIRKAMSKTLGVEFFDKMYANFEIGALKNGLDKEESRNIWDHINTMGSWCLAGNTRVKLSSAGNNLKSGVTIEELYEKYVLNRSPWIRQNHSMPMLVSLDEQKGRCFPQRVDSIIKTGKKQCNRYLFDDDTYVDCTHDHRFIIDGKWLPAKDALIGSKFASSEYSGTGYIGTGEGHGHAKGKKYSEKNEGFLPGKGNPAYKNGKTKAYNDFIVAMENKPCQRCNKHHHRIEIHHIDMLGGSKDPYALEWLCPSCHKIIHYDNGRNKRWSVGHKIVYKTLVSIEDIGEMETYDISMPTHHNFALYNGVITHNSFNKSHSVSYGLISYLTAYMKANYPLEFLVASLNHAKNDQSAIKILRDAVENDGVEYTHIDPMLSKKDWSVQDGMLYGGLKTIHGIGPAKANKIIKSRLEGTSLQAGIQKSLTNGASTFKYLYPARELYGDYYSDPQSHGLNGSISEIKNAHGNGMFTLIGCLIKKNLRDANEACFVSERGGSYENGQTAWLNITLEDDTDSIMCKIQKKDYERLGRIIAETGKVDKDWYMVYGEKINNWHLVFVKNVMKITRDL